MLYKICYIFLMFLIYSFVGYILEVISCSLHSKKFVFNRGFCLGPYLPIYGISCMLMGFFILKYKSDPFTVFVMSAFICGTVEFFTSYILEKIFNARWWDYSERKFNIDGRVCLSNIFLFGIGGVLFTYFLHPFVTNLLDKLTYFSLIIIGVVAITIFVIDVSITIITMCQVKISSIKFKNKDITAEITKIIRMEISKKKEVYSNFFVRHMLNAFPKIDLSDYSNPLSRLKRYTRKDKKK